MALLKCKLCGGDIKATDSTFGTCESCGSTMTLPKASYKRKANDTPEFIPRICKDKYINDEIAKEYKSISTCVSEIASARAEISAAINEENRILDEQRRAGEIYWMQHSSGFTESSENRVYTEMLKSVWNRKHRAENSIREWNQINANSEARRLELEALLLLTPEVRAERHYQTLVDTKEETKNAEEFAGLAQKFREMEGYKDAEKLAVECDNLSKSVKKQREEKERKEKEQKAAKERKEKEQKAAQERKEAEKAQKNEVRELNAVIDSIRAHGVIMEKKLSEWHTQSDEWKAKGLCAHCGGKLGLFKSCKTCKKRASDIPVYDRRDIPILTVRLGGYSWRVLDVESDRALLLTDNIIDNRYFHPTKCNLWGVCKLREYLNGWFLDKFNAETKKAILETKNTHDNAWYTSINEFHTEDKIFLLSLEEVIKYFGDSGLLHNRPNDKTYKLDDCYNSARIARYAGGKAKYWLLRTPGASRALGPVGIDSKGRIDVAGGNLDADGYDEPLKGLYRGQIREGVEYGIRPALWLGLTQKE
jgi:hypothetical protein